METEALHQVEPTLRESEERLRLAVAATGIGIWDVNTVAGTRRWSDEFRAILGLPAEIAADPKLFSTLIHPVDRNWVNERYRNAYDASGDGRYEAEFRIRRFDDGAERWVRTKGQITFDNAGRVVRGVGTLLDITDQKVAQEAVRESEERYRLAMRAFHGALYESHLDTGYGYRAPGAYEMLGLHPEKAEPTREWWFRRIHSDDAPGFHRALNDLLEGRTQELNTEYRIRHKDGGWVWLWQRGIIMRDAEGRPTRLIGALLDITERKHAEQAVRRSEKRFRRLMAQSPLSVQTIAPDGRIREVNKAWEELFGVTLADIPDYNTREDAQLDARGIRPFLDRAFSGEPVELPPVVYVPDRGRYAGRDLWTRAIAYPVTDDAGQVEEVVLIHRDITEQKHAEAALRESEARFRHMADSAPALIWMTDARGQVTFANMHFEYVFGRPAVGMHGDGWRDVLELQDIKAFTTAFREAFHARRPFRAEVRVRDKRDRIRWLRCEGVPRLDDAGQYLGYTGCAVDITDSKAAAVRQELLINELNHRVKNTLATVQSLASQSLRNATTMMQAREAFEARLMALSRVHDVLTRESWEGAGLHEIVAQAIEPYCKEGDSRVDIEGPQVRLSPRVALAFAMALQELATNAVKYGALSSATGCVLIAWRLERSTGTPRLRLCWEETGGPPVEEPTRRGFGSRLLERSLAGDLDGEVRMNFPLTGVVCTFDAVVARAA